MTRGPRRDPCRPGGPVPVSRVRRTSRDVVSACPSDLVARPPPPRARTSPRPPRGPARPSAAWWDAPAPARANALGAAAAVLRSGRRGRRADGPRGRQAAGEAAGEVGRAVAILEYYAQAAYAPLGSVLPPACPGCSFTERRPHGVAALVTPWNFPLAIPLWKAAPALAAGNAVLLKPAPAATGCALWLQNLLAGVAARRALLQVLPGGAADRRGGAGRRRRRELHRLGGGRARRWWPRGRPGRAGAGRDGRAERRDRARRTPTRQRPPRWSPRRRWASPGRSAPPPAG